MSESIDLKRCPFCGGEAEITKCGIICDEAYVVVCKECKARTRMEFVYKPKVDEATDKTKDDFIREAREASVKKWNRRASNG